MSAESVAKALYSTWISRFGCPHRITTDQGRQFESQLLTSLTNLLGVRRCRTTPYRPQANGLMERWHRTLKAAIMRHETDNWYDLLPTILLGLRSGVKEDLGCSPAELTYSSQIRLLGEFFFDTKIAVDPMSFAGNLRQQMRDLRPTPATNHDVHKKVFVHKELSKCSHVFLRDDAVRRPLQPPYTGPHKIIQRNNKTFKIDVNGRQVTVNVDRVKARVFVAGLRIHLHSNNSPTPYST
ncbi:uncharacterized protein LOC103314496 [Tribolium castaneum]|uniref:Retrovirus-related Pol polyprotein from transposon 412-like Protein n=1 Tax=Tribolium castaneum TaxID=7070 RepID=D7ELG0_TRICA|nr:PREDICTED: uncharacterized protein LOC103314496 [Tribolium castaneum]EFA12072.1 Retrovirus-related Pol polyprotein from transposon 412-like Protein [Tribolium castaneum]|eukprot:XP_008198969.1 PREDICTED: uncharacterized protein LOC103314496 [Tribolium castaneum]